MKFLRSEQRVRNGYFGAFALLILIYSFVFLSMLQMAKRFSGHEPGLQCDLESQIINLLS